MRLYEMWYSYFMSTNNSAGRKVKALRSKKGQKIVLRGLMSNYFDSGTFHVIYGEGGVKNHIAVSENHTVSLCGRNLNGTSTTPFSTLIPGLCYKCESIYEVAFTSWLGSQAIKRISNPELNRILSEVEEVIRSNPENWVKAVGNITI